jgi:hypothetical protein
MMIIEEGKPPNHDSRFPNRKTFPPCDVRGYNICCEARPYSRELPGRWKHPKAEDDGTDEDFQYGLEYDRYKCPICGLSFSVEVPQ